MIFAVGIPSLRGETGVGAVCVSGGTSKQAQQIAKAAGEGFFVRGIVLRGASQ